VELEKTTVTGIAGVHYDHTPRLGVWSQCTPVPERQTDGRTYEHHGNSATIRSGVNASRAKHIKTIRDSRSSPGKSRRSAVAELSPTSSAVANHDTNDDIKNNGTVKHCIIDGIKLLVFRISETTAMNTGANGPSDHV